MKASRVVRAQGKWVPHISQGDFGDRGRFWSLRRGR